jgi:cell division protein FtsW
MVSRRTKRFHSDARIDGPLFIAYVIALVAGLVMIYSTSSILAESRFGSHFYFLWHQFLWAGLSLGAILVITKIDLEKVGVYSPLAYLLTLALLGLVFLMPARNDSHRWLELGPLSVQPSELFKCVMIFFLAYSLTHKNHDITDGRQLLRRYVPLLVTGLALILLEPHLGATIVVFLTAGGMLFLAGVRVKHVLLSVLPLVGTATFVVFVLGYKKARLLDYLSSVADPLQGSYQAKQAALTLGAGGIFGMGLGEGRQKLFFLPYPHTDFAFAAMGEEIGLIGLLFVLACLFFILWRGLRIASAQPDRFGYLLAAGMTLSLFVNIVLHIGVATSLLPVMGLALPLFSYGGSSLLMSSVAVGVLLNLSKRMAR